MASKNNEQLLYAAKLMLSYAGGELQRTNLMKSLFYLDLFWLQEHGCQFTGARWVALPQGPVVENYKNVLIKPLLADENISESEQQFAPKIKAQVLTLDKEAVIPPNSEVATVAIEVEKFIGGKNARAVSKLSHDNIAWKIAYKKGSGTPINMVLALDQIADDDAWLRQPLTADEIARIRTQNDQPSHPF